jgi:pSer/pThr/pTyr-binding forkhead associated (FHA) protein
MAFIQSSDNGIVKTSVLPDDRLCIFGRGSHCDFRLELDAELSREHFGISPDESGKIVLIDLGSRNGTFLNGKQLINETVELKDGDEIRAGTQSLKFYTHLSEEKVETLISNIAEAISEGKGFQQK